VTSTGTWAGRAATFARAATLVLAAVVIARTVSSGLSSVNHEIATLAAQDRALAIRGGDVSLRDAPKAQELRAGRFFSDPYYAGEHHWYPFLTPLVAATVSQLGGGSIPEAFFRAELGFVALYLLSLGVLAFLLARWQGLLFVPVAVWLGALAPGNGLYPTEAARGAFLLFLGYAGLVLEDPRLPARRAALLGLSVGLLGLWNGASFFVAAAITGTIAAVLVWPSLRQRRARGLAFLPVLVGAAALPLAMLFAPEVLRHGRLAVPEAARTWMADIYLGGTLTKALTLRLAPRGFQLALLLAVLVRLGAARRLGLPPRPRATPLVLAYLLCLALAHLGFVAADRAHPLLARVAAALLPAPAHTFLSAAEACRPAIAVLGLVSLVELFLLLLRRLRVAVPVLPALVPALSLVAFATLTLTFPYRITRFSSSESRPFVRFAAAVAARAGTTPIFFRYPGRLVQWAPLKILELSVAEYANPYVHAERSRAADAIDEALRTGSVAHADALLDQYGIGFIMEDPRAPTDPVIRRCGGAILLEQDGYRLRKREHCGM
jgi:hypothetical protein